MKFYVNNFRKYTTNILNHIYQEKDFALKFLIEFSLISQLIKKLLPECIFLNIQLMRNLMKSDDVYLGLLSSISTI